jgi:hypothetical protein
VVEDLLAHRLDLLPELLRDVDLDAYIVEAGAAG